MKQWLIGAAIVLGFAVPPAVYAGEPGDSQRLERAKDFIADEQWERAIEQLKAAAADSKEKNKDEALFWLAHSQHQARDLAAALQSITDLERAYAASRWVKPARSLRIEIAQKLRRNDVLWMTAAPPAATAPVALATPPKPPTPFSGTPRAPRASAPTPPPAPATVLPAPGSEPAPGRARMAAPPPATTPMPPPSAKSPQMTTFFMTSFEPDTNLRLQALGSLLATDAARVIPMLREIALESPNANEASRAVFLLAQSGNAQAHSTVVDVARQGSELVQIAAVKELGRFGGANVSEELLQVYKIGNPRVKYQVVHSLGDRAATPALMRIAQTESDRRLQETAIVRLGQAGGSDQLRRFYVSARPELKRPIIISLFNARAVDELIYIASQEKDEAIQQDVLTKLRLLNTQKAQEFLQKQRKK